MNKWHEFLLGWLIPGLVSVGIVGGLFLFVVFLCAGVGGYDPQTMFDGLIEDFKMFFS